MAAIVRNPIITFSIIDNSHNDINGPSCIELPNFVKDGLGRYYLYFAHHRGDRIQLAYADTLTGPWTVHGPGALSLTAVEQCHDHIASPDVVVDTEARELLMYFHGMARPGHRQLTYLARSTDGLKFTADPQPIADFYLRVVRWRNIWIGMSKGGVMYFSRDGRKDFNRLPAPALPLRSEIGNMSGDTRHVALHLEGDRLWVAFSRIGDAPERILLGYVDLLQPMDQWKIREHVSLLEPELEFEGANIPVAQSRAGAASGAENALRDPYILQQQDGLWLFYAFAGEQGIGLAKLPPLSDWYLAHRTATQQTGEPHPDADKMFADAIKALQAPGALEQRLMLLDQERPAKRIFVMGCGRSGTWLLTALMSGFTELTLIAKELPVEVFGTIRPPKSGVVFKRFYESYKFVERIPGSIFVLYILRHPFDVLSSHNPVTGSKYHISAERWLGEMNALKYLVDSKRENFMIVSYEDLVRDPQTVMSQIATRIGMEYGGDPVDVLGSIELPPEATKAMHGQRPVDQNSIGSHRRDPDALAHLRGIVPSIQPMLDWVSVQFGYDVQLPED